MSIVVVSVVDILFVIIVATVFVVIVFVIIVVFIAAVVVIIIATLHAQVQLHAGSELHLVPLVDGREERLGDM